MGLISTISHPKRTLKRKLFGYMLLLTALLLLTLFIALFLFGRFHSTQEDTYAALELQLDAFEKDIAAYFDHLAAASVQLSGRMSVILESYLLENRLTMADLTDSAPHLAAIQDAMLEPLRQKLLQENCSGIFVMLDTTINSTLERADVSRSGLYLQINGYNTGNETILLYRGPSDLGKQHGMMPHRKWHLEFRTDRFPNYAEILTLSQLPADEAYYLTDVTVLPGTSEQVLLLVVPVTGRDGTFYGICGMEVSASYFMAYHAQPSRIPHLTCLLTPSGSGLNTDAGLSCGISGGYYRAPKGTLTTEEHTGLCHFSGDTVDYIGVHRSISLTPNNAPYSLAVLTLQDDYDQNLRKSTLQNILLWLLILCFAINCCLFFSRRFLAPILNALDQLKTKERARSNIPEIDDLSSFLSRQDLEYEENLRTLTLEKEQFQTDYEKARTEITRLSYKMKQEVDQDEYQYFRCGLHDLTPTERKIFDLYSEGKSGKEILELLQIKENTLKFHNKGIYSKLGVSSRKQLLQYAALLKQEPC